MQHWTEMSKNCFGTKTQIQVIIFFQKKNLFQASSSLDTAVTLF